MSSSTCFVYAPRSGDRVFAQQTHPEVAVIKWSNGCRHVIGGVTLRWYTANPGAHWRAQCRALCAAVVRATGGIAWDAQGEVTLRVPVGHAWDAWRLINGASPDAPAAPYAAPLHDPNVATLVATGAAALVNDPERGLILAQGAGPEHPPVRWARAVVDCREEGTEVTLEGEGQSSDWPHYPPRSFVKAPWGLADAGELPILPPDWAENPPVDYSTGVPVQ